MHKTDKMAEEINVNFVIGKLFGDYML
ncbi:hypothetical protein ATW7_07097 [Alteromonadales bacterium TW-7]|nr:hypothetical protein ATW7_07097 [Alteromonadales bacterium TW-7]